ncbi:MAG: glycosyltransferase [Sphingomonas sp.]|nr:glycosyltransferase [Sphingomonas sp.]
MTLLLVLLLAPLSLLTLCFAVELFTGLRALREPVHGPSSKDERAVSVVPAHNEEAILAERLSALREAAEGQARILVVADNCSDSTAEIARHIGVDVVERTNPELRGKGFALDFARRELERDPPDVVLIIDADCKTDRQSIALLVSTCATTGEPCQATNIQIPSASSSPAVKLSTFAFFVKNVIRQRALQRLAGRVHLLGTGIALPWTDFAAAQLATADIVEDLKLGQELAEAGRPPRFVERAMVWSNAETERNTLSQRRRWEGGFLRNAFSSGPAMLDRSMKRGEMRSMWAAVNIMIPPFALLLLIDFAGLALGTVTVLFGGGSWWPVALLATTVLLSGAGLIGAWAAGGYRFVSLGDLARAPLYLAWKLPVYLGFARHGAPKDWKRTDRSAV